VGKASFGGDKLHDNAKAFLETIIKLKPQSAKGTYVRSVTISTTMGPGIKVDPAPLLAALESR
jgi:large subunit ribosomal protein L1